MNSLFSYNSSPSAWIKLFKYDIIKNYQFSKGFYEDMPLIRLYKRPNVCIGYLNKPLYNYYYREGSIITKVDMRVLDMFKQYDLIYEAYKDDDSFQEGLSHLLYYWTGRILEKVVCPQYVIIRKEIIQEFEKRKSQILPLRILLIKHNSFRRKLKLIKYYFNYHFNQKVILL